MNNESTGNTIPATDWTRVKAMTDADISHNADSPSTVESDWVDAVLKQGGVIVGYTKKPETSKSMSG
jgi:hypothetical protein